MNEDYCTAGMYMCFKGKQRLVTQVSKETLIAKMFFSMKLLFQVILPPDFSAVFSS